MGSSRAMKIGFIAFAMLIVCSLIGSALIYVPFDELFDFGDGGDDLSENIPDPNEDVIAEIRQTAEANPDDVNAVLLLADVLGNTGKLDEAIPQYEKAIELAPDDASVRYAFARALADGDRRADAELQFQKVLEMEPDHQAALYYLAELYMEWEPRRQEEAEALYQRAIEADPDSFLASQAKDRLTTIAPSPAASASPQASPASDAGTPVGDGTGG
jgi:cytochrome c-type biogenesis protein CcmH/NrfG